MTELINRIKYYTIEENIELLSKKITKFWNRIRHTKILIRRYVVWIKLDVPTIEAAWELSEQVPYFSKPYLSHIERTANHRYDPVKGEPIFEYIEKPVYGLMIETGEPIDPRTFIPPTTKGVITNSEQWYKFVKPINPFTKKIILGVD